MLIDAFITLYFLLSSLWCRFLCCISIFRFDFLLLITMLFSAIRFISLILPYWCYAAIHCRFSCCRHVTIFSCCHYAMLPSLIFHSLFISLIILLLLTPPWCWCFSSLSDFMLSLIIFAHWLPLMLYAMACDIRHMPHAMLITLTSDADAADFADYAFWLLPFRFAWLLRHFDDDAIIWWLLITMLMLSAMLRFLRFSAAFFFFLICCWFRYADAADAISMIFAWYDFIDFAAMAFSLPLSPCIDARFMLMPFYFVDGARCAMLRAMLMPLIFSFCHY